MREKTLLQDRAHQVQFHKSLFVSWIINVYDCRRPLSWLHASILDTIVQAKVPLPAAMRK